MNFKNRIVIVLTLITISCVSIGCGGSKNGIEKNIPMDEKIFLDESIYSVNTFKGASLSVVEDSVTNKSISVKVIYAGKNTGLLGSWFSIEIYKYGKWYILPYIKDNLSFDSIAYPIDESGFRIMDYNWNYMYHTLPSGQYRIITKILDFVEAGNFNEYYLAAEFNIE